MSKHEPPDGQLEVVSRKYCISDIMTAMLDFGLVVYGQCTSTMEDYEDPRIERSCGAKLVATWEHMGLGEDYQRAQLGEHYDAAKADLAQYRHLKALAALAEARARGSGVSSLSDLRTAVLRIFRSDLSDGAKVAALAGLLTGASTAREIATVTNRSLRSVERHHSELRTWDCAELRRGKLCGDGRSSEYAEVRSHDDGEGSTSETGKADPSPDAEVCQARAA